jgi:hypothetical protein
MKRNQIDLNRLDETIEKLERIKALLEDIIALQRQCDNTQNIPMPYIPWPPATPITPTPDWPPTTTWKMPPVITC